MTPTPPSDLRDAQRDQRRIAAVSILAAIVLVAVKLAAGLQSGSLGMLAEALHSGADLVAATLTFVAIRVGQRPPDRQHPWGHGRAEHLAALGEALLLLTATVYIAIQAVMRLARGEVGVVVESWLLLVALVVIVIDVWRTLVSHRAARTYGSPALASNALHFASDLAGSLAVFIGLALVSIGFGPGDALAALVVSAIVGYSAWRLLWDNAQVLMDVAPEGAQRAATRAVNNLDMPFTLQRLRIRRSAGVYLADIVIGVSSVDHVGQGHAVANAVEEAVIAALPGSDVVVHVEPDEQSGTIRDRVTAAVLARPGIHEVHNVRVLLLDETHEVSMHLKVDASMRLDTAHDLADDVEADVRAAVPGITHVVVHIEPVDTHVDVAGEVHDPEVTAIVERSVHEVTGRDPIDIRLRSTRKGLVAYVAILAAADQSLADAHELATQVEERIRERAPAIDDVVVHTEPINV
ncbi:MAG: cation diffusion facilitator family transporter [Gaiellales bacterium]